MVKFSAIYFIYLLTTKKLLQMDIQTTLEIIKMIDAKIWNIAYPNKAYRTDDIRIATLVELKNHLQSYIEEQLNASELQTGE